MITASLMAINIYSMQPYVASNINDALFNAVSTAYQYPDHNLQAIHTLLQQGAKDVDGHTLLRALEPRYNGNGNIAILDMLIKSGASTANIKWGGVTDPLTFIINAWSSEDALLQAIPLLLSSEPRLVTITDQFGKTPLASASQRGFVRVAQLLRQHGATH